MYHDNVLRNQMFQVGSKEDERYSSLSVFSLMLQTCKYFIIGATIDYRDGFTGCIRAMLLNGQPANLRSYANHLYGMMVITLL